MWRDLLQLIIQVEAPFHQLSGQLVLQAVVVPVQPTYLCDYNSAMRFGEHGISDFSWKVLAAQFL